MPSFKTQNFPSGRFSFRFLEMWVWLFLVFKASTLFNVTAPPNCKRYLSVFFLGYMLTPSIEALGYKPQGRWFDSRCCHESDRTMALGSNQPVTEISKVKVKWSRYRPGVAQRVGRGITLLFHDRGTRRGWVVSSTPRPHFTPGKDPVPILQVAGWAENLVPTGIRSRTVQPVVSRYTDWVTRPTTEISTMVISWGVKVTSA